MSKELETLNYIKNGFPMKTSDLENALDIIEKSLKALEIIKEKKVNVGDFVRCKNMQDYNDYCCYNEKEHLTPQEYDLLKEVFYESNNDEH